MSASIEAIDPAIVKLPVSKNDMINVVHIDNNRYDSDLYMWICNAFRSLSFLFDSSYPIYTSTVIIIIILIKFG